MSIQPTKETKPRCGHRAKLCYMDTGSFDILIIADNFYKDIANDFERCSYVEIIWGGMCEINRKILFGIY